MKYEFYFSRILHVNLCTHIIKYICKHYDCKQYMLPLALEVHEISRHLCRLYQRISGFQCLYELRKQKNGHGLPSLGWKLLKNKKEIASGSFGTVVFEICDFKCEIPFRHSGIHVQYHGMIPLVKRVLQSVNLVIRVAICMDFVCA